MKRMLLRSAIFGLCAVLIFLISAVSLFAETWVWRADNHKDNISHFADSKTTFTMTTEDGGRWFWDDPSPGMVSFRNLKGWQRIGTGRGRGFGRSSDFGEALDLNKGVTIAARVKPVSAFSAGTICLSVENKSTSSLPGGSTHLWVGWDVPDMVLISNRSNKAGDNMKRFDSSVKYEGRWCIWTFGGKRIGDTVAWDVWIDGVHQGADQKAPDGSLHTMICTQATELGTTVTIGESILSLDPHDTVWDYVAITNQGIISGWTGNVEPGKEKEGEPSLLPQWHQDMLTKSAILRVLRLVKLGRYDEVIETCDDALERYTTTEPNWRSQLMGSRVVALVRKGQVDEALAVLRIMQDEASSSEEKVRLTWQRGNIYFDAKRYSEAAEVYRTAIRTDKTEYGQGKSRYQLGICYRELGYNDLARNYMEGVIERYPKGDWAMKARGQLYLWGMLQSE